METDVARRLADAAVEMVQQPDLEATLDSICSHAISSTGADACGIFVVEGGRVRMASTSEPALVKAEQVQIETGQGPCLETVWRSHTYQVPNMRYHARWPVWAAQLAELGWLSTLSVRLHDGDQTIGFLNLYSHQVDGFDEHDVELAPIFASHASVALLAARQQETLRTAVAARHAIGVAQGILMERYGFSMAAAFETLRRHSQDSNTRLQLIAQYVIEHHDLPGRAG